MIMQNDYKDKLRCVAKSHPSARGGELFAGQDSWLEATTWAGHEVLKKTPNFGFVIERSIEKYHILNVPEFFGVWNDTGEYG